MLRFQIPPAYRERDQPLHFTRNFVAFANLARSVAEKMTSERETKKFKLLPTIKLEDR